MRRLLQSKPPGNISTPPPPAELVKGLASRRDSRVLAATSSAIALSLGSARHDIRDPSDDDATARGRDTNWQTAYSVARMAVEIAKETSDMFLPLKAVVGAVSVLIKNYDQTSDNAETVKDIERRLQSLSGVLASPMSEDDHAEKGRRMELRRKLEGVIAKLEPLSDQHVLASFLHNIDNAKTLVGFVQELADAIIDYQVSVQQAVYERTRSIHGDTKNIISDTGNILGDTGNILGDMENILGDTKNIIEATDLEVLAKLEPVRNAGYQAGHHDKCLPGTRQSVLRDIMFWTKNPQDQNIFWLNGLAGTGKSTIAQSFSDMVASEGFLGASFFCSRDYLDRKELKNIFPTLAYQLACHYPHFQSHIIRIIKNDPTLAHTSLILQFENLLVNPLSENNISCVIIIDALDECIDDQPASAILSVLGRFAKQLPLVKFFITGRPEPRIRSGFRLPLLEPLTQIFLLHEVESSSVDNDIQLYLTQRLTTIAKQRSDVDLPNPWPHNHEIVALTKKSSGLFIFASTLARFIESEYHNPSERLQLVLSKTSGTMHEGRAGIDSLYSQVLLHAFSDVHELEVFDNVKRVLGAIILAFNPLSRWELSRILGVSMTLVSTTLRHLHSVILIPGDENKEIRIFHKSFPDFLQDEKRCTDPRFCINPVTYHNVIALGCLELVKKLKRNPCSLPPFIMNHDIPNLPQLLENVLGGATQYACRCWAKHLELSLGSSPENFHQVIVSVTEMLKSAPPWIEVMSLENHLEEVIYSIHGLLDWLDNTRRIVQENLSTVRNINETIWRNSNTTWWNTSAAQEAAKTAEQKIIATRLMAKVIDSVTTPLHKLAMDCLQLSMHFFYPIQQCAQQVYYTALPLSPTSSQLCKSCLQSTIDGQLPHVTAFLGAPNTWGLLLRTINIKQKQLTCIATSSQKIIAACEGTVNVYNAVTGVLQQSLYAPGTVVKIQGTPDESILFFAHSFSVTMWDVQTGGLIHTFTTQSEINDIAVSIMGDHIACGLADGSIRFWDINTKEEGKGFGDGKPVITIHWLSSMELAVVTQNSVYTENISLACTLGSLSFPGHLWGMVHLFNNGGTKFLVGSSLPGIGESQDLSSFETVLHQPMTDLGQLTHLKAPQGRQPPMYLGQLTHPTLVGDKIACITPPNGVQLFDLNSHVWTNNSPLLNAAISIAVSLGRNLVVQAKESIQIFSLGVLGASKAHNSTHPSHIYPLGKKHIVCLQPTRHLTLLELDTLQELHPDNNASPLGSLPTDQPHSTPVSAGHGLVAELGIPAVMQAWQSGVPLPEWVEAPDEDAPLSGLSPKFTWVVTVYGSPRRELRVNDAMDGTLLASLSLEDEGLEIGEVYDLTFDSETRFHLNIDGLGGHIRIPYDIVASPSEHYSHTITQGEPMPLSEPRATPPYTLDANCEWVVDAEMRKICWISPENIRRGDGSHFWAGLSLVVVGDDGVVRKLTFKEPNC